MRRSTLVILFAFAACAGARADPRSEALWARARDAWAAGLAYKPGRMIVRGSELDASGAATSFFESEFELVYEGGETRQVLVRASKDGKDRTDQARAQATKEEAKEAANRSRARDGEADEVSSSSRSGYADMGPMDLVPFSPKIERITRLGEPVEERFETVLPYEILDPKTMISGRLRFDAEGRPLSLRYELGKLPLFMSEASGEVRFETLPDGELVIASVSFEGTARILFIRKRFAGRIEPLEYAREP